MRSSGLPDMIKLHFLVLIWGFAAVLGRLISIPSVEIVFYRTGLAAIGLWILLRVTKVDLKINSKDLIKILGIGAVIGAHWIFFFASARISTVSVCLAGMATISLWTSLLEPIFHKRRIYVHEILLSLLLIVGLYTIFHFEFRYWLGLLFGVIAAFLAALFSVFNSGISSKFNHHLITYYEMVGACLLVVIFAPFYVIFLNPEGLELIPVGYDWAWLLILALVCTVYAYSHYVELMKRLTPFAINIVLNLEPVYGIILALIIFGDSEKMDSGFYLGAGIILTTLFLYPILNRKNQKKPTIPGMS